MTLAAVAAGLILFAVLGWRARRKARAAASLMPTLGAGFGAPAGGGFHSPFAGPGGLFRNRRGL